MFCAFDTYNVLYIHEQTRLDKDGEYSRQQNTNRLTGVTNAKELSTRSIYAITNKYLYTAMWTALGLGK